MVTYVSRATINGVENRQKAIEWASRVCRYAENRFGFSNMRPGLEVYGRVGTMWRLGDHRNLESLAKAIQASWADDGYRRLLNEARGLFVLGSIEDIVIQRW